MSNRKSFKPQSLATRGRKATATPNTSTSSTSSTPSTSTGKRNRQAPDYCGFESSVCSVRDQETAPALKRQRTINPVIETVIPEEAPQTQVEETNFELPIVSPPDPTNTPTF